MAMVLSLHLRAFPWQPSLVAPNRLVIPCAELQSSAHTGVSGSMGLIFLGTAAAPFPLPGAAPVPSPRIGSLAVQVTHLPFSVYSFDLVAWIVCSFWIKVAREIMFLRSVS